MRDGGRRRAAVLTVSDGVARGIRDDASGPAVAEALGAKGYEVVAMAAVADDRAQIEAAIRDLAPRASLVVTTGGTGFGPRDVTPEATTAVIERAAPGLAEAMRAAGRRTTPMADLSRGVAGTIRGALVLNLPGSPRGAVESLEAVLPVLPHALGLLEGDAGHAAHEGDERSAVPDGLEPHSASADPNVELARRLERGDEVVMATAVTVHGRPPCRPGQKVLLGRGGPLAGTLGCAEFDAAALADVPVVLASGEPAVRTYEHPLGTVEVSLEPHAAPPRLVVLGATPVALWLLRWGSDLGYETALVESRAERVSAEHREAARQVAATPHELAPAGDVDAIHTDHEAPDVAEHLASLVRSGARFVGLMGSRGHASRHLDEVRALGLDDDEVARIRTPVGLDIGARSPQEIALSILAGLIAARAGRAGTWLDRDRVGSGT